MYLLSNDSYFWLLVEKQRRHISLFHSWVVSWCCYITKVQKTFLLLLWYFLSARVVPADRLTDISVSFLSWWMHLIHSSMCLGWTPEDLMHGMQSRPCVCVYDNMFVWTELNQKMSECLTESQWCSTSLFRFYSCISPLNISSNLFSRPCPHSWYLFLSSSSLPLHICQQFYIFNLPSSFICISSLIPNSWLCSL